MKLNRIMGMADRFAHLEEHLAATEDQINIGVGLSDVVDVGMFPSKISWVMF